jgi:hypothetical protein
MLANNRKMSAEKLLHEPRQRPKWARADLLQLIELAARTPHDIRNDHPSLFGKLQDLAIFAVGLQLDQHFEEASPKLRRLVRNLDLAPLLELEISPNEYVRTQLLNPEKGIRPSTRRGGCLPRFLARYLNRWQSRRTRRGDVPAIVEEARTALTGLDLPETLDDLLLPELPVRANSLFSEELRQASVYQVAELARLNDSAATAIVKEGLDPSRITSRALRPLVERGALTEAEAGALEFQAGLYQWTGGNVNLVTAVRRNIMSADGQPLSSLQDLARNITREGVAASLREAGLAPPDDPTLESAADALAREIERLFPDEAWRGRFRLVDVELLQHNLAHLAPLLEANPHLFAGAREAALDLTNVPEEERETALAAYRDSLRLANRHPGLQLHEVFGGPQRSVAARAAEVARRLSLLEEFQRRNSSLPLLSVDTIGFSDEPPQLDFGDMSETDREFVLNEIRSDQRMFRVTQSPEHAYLLKEAGYQAALQMAAMSDSTFLDTLSLSADTALRYHDQAQAVAGLTIHNGGLILELFNGQPRIPASGSVEIEPFLRRLSGFSDYFGGHDYCRCRHCQSITSPAAYFVDLMAFIETHILTIHFPDDLEEHALSLRQRRPDLWKGIELTCENTNSRVPYLVIINEILENYIWLHLDEDRQWDYLPRSRAEVEEEVYTALYEPGSPTERQIQGFRQPFLLPLERLSIYLEHFPFSRAEIAAAILRYAEVDEEVIIQAKLGYSPFEYALVREQNHDVDFLERLYGFDQGEDAERITIRPGEEVDVDALRLLAPMGIERRQLTELITAQFVNRPGPAISIQGIRSEPGSVQPDREVVSGLDQVNLDRMHRFVRLWRRLPWRIPELDLVLSRLDTGGGALPLGNIAALRDVQERLGVSVEALCALIGDIPHTPLGENRSLFDRLFNLPPFDRDAWTPSDLVVTFWHPAFHDDDLDDAETLTHQRLLAGLQLEDEALFDLIQRLRGPLAADPDGRFTVNLATLSLLYRHARLAKLLGLDVGQFIQLLSLLADDLSAGHVADLAALQALLAFHDWRQTTRFSLDDLAFITGGAVLNPAAYTPVEDLLARLVELAEAPEEGDAPPEAGELAATLLAGAFGMETPRLLALARLAGTDLADEPRAAAIREEIEAVIGGDAPSDMLSDLILRVQRLHLLFSDAVFTAEVLDLVYEHGGRTDAVLPYHSDGAALWQPTLADVRLLLTYGRLLAQAEGDADMLHRALAAYESAAGSFDDGEDEAIAAVLAADEGMVHALRAGIALPASDPAAPGGSNRAVAALDTLWSAVKLAQELGIGGDMLLLFASTSYAELDRAADAVYTAFRMRYDDEKRWQEKIEPFEDAIRERRRDALTDYLMRTVDPERFATTNDLFHWFLIDTELQGCARTSRVAAGIASLQLYVQRCLLHLEQSADGLLRASLAEKAAAQWEWRKNYRVWEANRKVFLWPENYLEPELRDDRTHLFRELETNLLQTNLDPQQVEDAYRTYMRGFEEIATLQISGAYHDYDLDENRDVLHIFGVTSSDPPVYYYRTVENLYLSELPPYTRGLVWNAWQRLDLQIPTRIASPIVRRGRLYLFWVELSTRPNSPFDGYKHSRAVKFSTRGLDGRWSTPQQVSLQERSATIMDRLDSNGIPRLIRYSNDPESRAHREAIDGYLLKDERWMRVFPTVSDQPIRLPDQSQFNAPAYTIMLTLGDPVSRWFATQLDMYRLRAAWTLRAGRLYYRTAVSNLNSGTVRRLYNFAGWLMAGDTSQSGWSSAYALAFEVYHQHFLPGGPLTNEPEYPLPLARPVPPDAKFDLINGSLSDGIFDHEGDLFLFHRLADSRDYFNLKRLSTSLTEKIGRRLVEHDIDALLDIGFQQDLVEKDIPFTWMSRSSNNHAQIAIDKGIPDFTGPLGVYFREIFFTYRSSSPPT